MSTIRATPEIEYNTYNFNKTMVTVDSEGNLAETTATDETIEIAKNWKRHIGSREAKDGYIAEGATKFAFMVRLAM
jgi:hypothetical protein